jgi:hypothetical protein
MSSYGELIQALGALKNVKEKRHGIKTLASLCSNRAFQVRIVQKGGWSNAILPLIISLDEECRKYAALAIANLSTTVAAHQQLLDENVLTHLVPILHSEEVQEVVVYVLNALGNFAVSPRMQPNLRNMNTVEVVFTTLKTTRREEVKINALFFLSNMTSDAYTRKDMMEMNVHETVWRHMQHPNYMVMQYSLAVLRGLSVEPQAQELLPRLGIVPLLIGIFQSSSPHALKVLVLDIFLHLSFLHSNAMLLFSDTVSECVVQAARSVGDPAFCATAVAIIANLCENIELHDRIAESDLFAALTSHIATDSFAIQQHVIRALMQLSLSPKYHHVILATDVMAKITMIAVTDKLPDELRINALQMMASVCATHPTTPTETDVMDLLYLICTETQHQEIRRAAMLVMANASAEAGNQKNILKKPYIEVLILCMSKATDVVLVDYLCQFFHNICKMDAKVGSMLIQCGYANHMFAFERLEGLSVTSAIYLCDTCRHLSDDAVVRQHLIERALFQTMVDAWAVYVEDPRLAPHLALMCSSFAHHSDCHQEFVMQHGVRLVIELYTRSEVEHVRLCCLLTLLYLADSSFSQRSIAQERGLQMLLSACEAETQPDLITNALKALIPFASSDDYRPQLGMDGGLDTFSSFLFSPHTPLVQLGIYLLQNLLELSTNRQIFLGIAKEKKTEEDYLEPLIRFLPTIKQKGGGTSKSKKTSPKKKGKTKEAQELTAHDPFTVRCCIHSLALLCLEQNEDSRKRFLELNIPQLLFTLFHSEQIDKSSGEAILLFMANLMHSSRYMQAGILRNLDIMPMLLSSNDLGFAHHTNIRCLSALLSISRTPEFKNRTLGQLDAIMANVNANISASRDESFYCTAALQCTLLCELALSSYESHEKMLRAGVTEAFLVFITVAGRGMSDEICIELLMSAVYGISALCSSPTCGEAFMKSLVYPTTRLQLLASLLRLPQKDINTTFHLGTVGVRTLQRTIDPKLEAHDLHIDNLDTDDFIDMCGVRPADFIYRHVVRTLSLILGNPRLSNRVQEALTVQNVVPTCQFALKGSDDIYVNTLGYVLVARFSMEEKLQTVFVNDAAIINEVLTCCRRFTPGTQTSALEASQQTAAESIAAGGQTTGMWSVHGVALNRYMLCMVTLCSLAERVKERYRKHPPTEDGEPSPETLPPERDLSYSNHKFLDVFTASCLQGLNAEELLEMEKVDQMAEFAALLRIIVVHNSLMTRLELEMLHKGGLVKTGEPRNDEVTAAEKTGQALVVPELRADFKNLHTVQNKCDGLINLVEKCLQMEVGKPLVLAILECLCALCYISPQSIKTPFSTFRLLEDCPTWVQTVLACVFCNTCADGTRSGDDYDEMNAAESAHIFPLVQTAPQETRRYMLGGLANIATRKDLFDFTVNSGVMRIYAPIGGRGPFVQEFGIIIEQIRILANLTCRTATHQEVCTESVLGFVRDCLKNCIHLLEGPMKNQVHEHDIEYDYMPLDFTVADEPPLGMRIRWEKPPKLTELLPDRAADRVAAGALEPGDELVEVNGVDVSIMSDEEIVPMFEMRPLQLVFRRPYKGEMKKYREWEDREEEDVPEVHTVSEYGDREQYVECFHLALLTLHNLAVSHDLHDKILAEPKILMMLLDIIPSDVLAPTLRRLIFSLLGNLAQNKDKAERIFKAMANYYMDVGEADGSLRKYIVLAANLFYTTIDKVEPDRSMLVFVGKLAEMEGDSGASQSLVEILHRMALGPRDFMSQFVCRETMVLTAQLVQLQELWGVQVRAFEVAYFLSMVYLQPALWASCDLIPNMLKAAAKVRAEAQMTCSSETGLQEDALWEMTMRSALMCLSSNVLVKQMHIAELDRYLMDLFMDHEKPAVLMECAGHLMSGLLQTEHAPGYWTRWKTMGAADKLLKWFQSIQSRLRSGTIDTSERVGEGLDSILHMLLWAVDIDSSLLVMLGARDCVTCIGGRLLSHAAFYHAFYKYQKNPDANIEQDLMDRIQDPEEIMRVHASFRGLAQMMDCLCHNEKAMVVLSDLGLSPTLITLMQLPSDDFREAAMVMLCSMCSHISNCSGLMRSQSFKALMKEYEAKLDNDPSSLVQDELQYLLCIIDRACCYTELAQLAAQEQLHLLSMLALRAESIDSQCLVLRALAECALVQPESVGSLPLKDLATLHYIMASNDCLTSEVAVTSDEDMSAVVRRGMIAVVSQRLKHNPVEAKLARHFARIILCEGISISRDVCQAAFLEMDFISYLGSLTQVFTNSADRVDKGHERLDVTQAHLMNNLISMLHVTLGAVFRGSGEMLTEKATDAKSAHKKKSVVEAIIRMLDAIHNWLCLSEDHPSPDHAPSAIGGRLRDDLRVMFFVSALLREICAQPLRSIFLEVVRTGRFHEVLDGITRAAVKRFMSQFSGPPAHDLFVAQPGKTSPLAHHYLEINLALVFEHLLVCMRHLITQSMYIPTPDLESGAHGAEPEPWSWVAQSTHLIYKDAANWLPDVVKRYGETTPAIIVEMSRYIAAVATFYVSPEAVPPEPEMEEAIQEYPLCEVYTLSDPRMIIMLTVVLEYNEDPCVIAMVVLAVSNFVEYGRMAILGKRRQDIDMNIDSFMTLVRALKRILEKVSDMPPDISIRCVLDIVRTFDCLLAYQLPELAYPIMDSGILETVQNTFTVFFRDVHKIREIDDYVDICQHIILFIRNWITVGAQTENEFEQRMVQKVKEDKHDAEYRGSLLGHLETIPLLDFLVMAVDKLVDNPRTGDIPDHADLLDELFEEIIVTMGTLLYRQSVKGKMKWEDMRQEPFEALLQAVIEHRRKRSGVFEDADMVNLLYIITKQHIRWKKVFFPDYVMRVAYGPRPDGHTEMQDVAAVCCAMIATQSQKGRKNSEASINIAEVVENCADFIHSMAKVPDKRMRLWHFRTITSWSQRPRVLDEVSAEEGSLRYIVEMLLDDLLMRYSCVFVHNISVLRHQRLLSRPGCLAIIMQSYRQKAPVEDSDDEHEMERRMLRHLLLSSVRNCFLGSSDLHNDLDESDLTAVVHLADCIEVVDIPLYLTILLYACNNLPDDRLAAAIPQHGPLVDLLTKCVLEFQAGGPEDLHDPKGVEAGLYNFAWEDRELESESEEEQAEEPGSPKSPTSPTSTWKSRQKAPPAEKVVGLGLKPSLYTKARTKVNAVPKGKAVAKSSGAGPNRKQAASVEKLRKEQLAEFVYYAAAEVLTQTTFREDRPELTDIPREEPCEEPSAIGDAIAAAFDKYSVTDWLKYVQERAALYNERKLMPTDLWVLTTMKFLWHCWCNKYFQHHLDKMANLRVIAILTPFFLDWRLQDVKFMMDQVCLYARLHQFSAVVDWLMEKSQDFPELACTLLSHSLVDLEEAHVTVRQASSYFRVFSDLLKERAVSRSGLARLAISIEVSLLMEHPQGYCAVLAQKEHRLLGDLLEALSRYVESATVKQSMVATLALTIGRFYKPLGEFDGLILRVLDMAPPLLEGQFEWFVPVLHRLAAAGGMKVQAPIINKKLHMRMARMMEDNVSEVETAVRTNQQISVREGPHLNAVQRIQWALAFFTVLAGAEGPADGLQKGSTQAPSLHFDAFICVDLLPVLVRTLKARPPQDTALSIGFLLASVCSSPTIVPHMPAILNCCKQGFPAVLDPEAAAEHQPIASESWTPFVPPSMPRMVLAMQRNLLHLLGRASFLPHQHPALLNPAASIGSWSMLQYVNSLESKPGIFENSAAPLHVKLFAIANMCSEQKPEVQDQLFDENDGNVLDLLGRAEEQLKADAKSISIAPCLLKPCDLRIIWVHAVVSLTRNSTFRMIKTFSGVNRLLTAMAWSEDLLRESRVTYSDVGIILECQQALTTCMVPLSLRTDFAPLRQNYTLFLLHLICSAPLMSLRLSACDCMMEILNKGMLTEVVSAVFLSTSCLEAFKRIISGPIDDYAIACCKVMIAFVQTGYYRAHVYLLGALDTVAEMMGSPAATSQRILWLAELFLVLTNQRTEEVIDAAVELPTIAPFLGLARERAVRKRELVHLWLETLGSSLYEIDEVTTQFQISTFHGYLYVASKCVLEPGAARDLRRIIFSVIFKRVERWRTTVFGIGEFFTISLMTAALPMCEKQPDLIAAVMALFHSFITQGETDILERIWSGGHYVWLTKRLLHKSKGQVLMMDPQATQTALNRAWDSHKDLTLTQSMTLRLLWELHHMFPVEVCTKVVDCGSTVETWQDYLKYYCHFKWPSDEASVSQATDSALLLALHYLETVVKSVSIDQQALLVQQGMVGLCLMVQLPDPEETKKMRASILKDRETWHTPAEFPEPSLYEHKMLAGTTAARLTHIPDVFKKMEEKKFAHQTISMFVHLHHLSPMLLDVRSRGGGRPRLEERSATLYMYLLSNLNLNWMVTNMGVGTMEVLCQFVLDMWHRHPSSVMQHHALRLFGTFCMVHQLYCSVFGSEEKASIAREAVYRMFGQWDVRELRHILRLLTASASYALGIPTIPDYVTRDVEKSVASEDGTAVRKVMQEGGAMNANQAASQHLLIVNYVAESIQRCEKFGDDYGRVWSLWLITTMFAHADRDEAPAVLKAGTAPPPAPSVLDPPQPILRFQATVDKEMLARRAQMLAVMEAAKPQKQGEAPSGKSIAFGKEDQPPQCMMNWARTSPHLSSCLAQVAGKAIAFFWRESQQIGTMAAARLFYELPLFLETAAFTLHGKEILICLNQAEHTTQVGSLLLGAMIASLRLPLRAQTLSEDFLKSWYDLQEDVIEGVVGAGEGPYDLLANWLRRGLPGSPEAVDSDFKAIIAFMIGQGLSPPLAVVPSLNVDTTERPEKAPGGGRNVSSNDDDYGELPTVAECPPAPAALLDRLAEEVLHEDLRLKQQQVRGEGPIFSSKLCHLLYALAVMVPTHPKVAAHSSAVRGAAFAQLMKVQTIIAQSIGSKELYDIGDGHRAKLFLFVRVSACIRGALQTIMGSWFAADFGARFAINDEGGRDFVQYCTKHIIQVYNNKMALTRVLGTPWERMMLTQGPTTTIAELLLVLCSSDANLQEVGRLGGQQALLCLSRYGETAQVRQQATMLLTKLAVLGAPAPPKAARG